MSIAATQEALCEANGAAIRHEPLALADAAKRRRLAQTSRPHVVELEVCKQLAAMATITTCLGVEELPTRDELALVWPGR